MDVSGKLKRSLTIPFHPNQVFEVSGTKVRFGTNVDYARFHQNGTRHLPKRRVVDLTEEQIDELAELVADRLVKPITE